MKITPNYEIDRTTQNTIKILVDDIVAPYSKTEVIDLVQPGPEGR